MKEVKDHIQLLLRQLATQFENGREDKDHDSRIRILQHAQVIQKIFQNRAFNLKDHLEKLKLRIDPDQSAEPLEPLPVTEKEMRTLEDKLLKHAELTKQPLTLTLPVNSEDTCWNKLLTQEQKDNNVIFIGKCGECNLQHEYPKCDKCKTPKKPKGPYNTCTYTKPEEEPYKGYCGNCFKIHQLPNCVQCQHYRIKPGRCTTCGAVGPDDTEWTFTCLNQDEQYGPLMEFILEDRKNTIAEQSKKFTTYKNCPLCNGYFHSAKACIFRKNTKYINILHNKIQFAATYSESSRITGKLILPTEDVDTEEESSDKESGSDDESYMVVIHHEPDDEDSSSDEGEYELEDGEPVIAFDRILGVIVSLHQTHGKPGNPSTQQWVEPGEGDEDINPDQGELASGLDKPGYGNLPPTLKNARKFLVFGEDPDDPLCELNLRSFENSICKVLPDTAEFPEDIFNIEGCIWCGSRGHDVLNCLGYANWIGDIWLGKPEERRLTYPQRQKRIEEILAAARRHYHNIRRPWELYVGLDDGEYLTEKGVKILIKDMKIINLIPRHLQTTTTIYADLPSAQEMSRMLHLSTAIQPAAQLTVMDELCNQTISLKEDMTELEVELKRSMALQVKDLKKDFQQEMQKFYTALMDDRIAALPQQFDMIREFLSKSLLSLNQRSLKSDLTVVRVFRELFEAKTPDVMEKGHL